MVDQPPEITGKPHPTNWKTLVGEPAPIVVSGSDALEDSPPSGESADKVQKETIADMQANRSLREKYAQKAYELACACISMWAVLLGAQGVIKALTGQEMWSEKVIIAVTTGVTVSVLAAFLGVIRGLFPHREKK